jgi:hypothetical protein
MVPVVGLWLGLGLGLSASPAACWTSAFIRITRESSISVRRTRFEANFCTRERDRSGGLDHSRRIMKAHPEQSKIVCLELGRCQQSLGLGSVVFGPPIDGFGLGDGQF